MLLFGATNVAFSQTTNSTEQCKTVMHEQIVQKKIDGKLRLQKIQVPMKICTLSDELYKKKPTPISHPPVPKIGERLQNLIDYCHPKTVKVGISVLGPYPDFRPKKLSGEYYGMPELTQEQRNEIRAKTIEYSIKKQENLTEFIKENNGRILTEDRYRTPDLFYAEIQTKLLKELEKRNDILRISPVTKYYITDPIYKKPSKPVLTIPEIIQREVNSGKDRIIVTVGLDQAQPDFAEFVTDNGGIIKHQESTQRFFVIDAPIYLIDEIKQRKGMIIGVTSIDSFDLCKWIRISVG